MKKLTLTAIVIMTTCILLSANNIETIYGKNELNYNNSHMSLYGNNFGTMLEFDQYEPRYIDIAFGREEIETLKSENETLSREAEIFRKQKESNKALDAEAKKLMGKIDLLLVDLKSTSAELFALKSTLTDKEMRQKLQVSIEENRQQIYDISNKKMDLYSKAEDLKSKIEIAQRMETVNGLFIRRNDKKIQYYEDCIAFSNRDSATLDTVIKKSTSYQSEVDDILNVSF